MADSVQVVDQAAPEQNSVQGGQILVQDAQVHAPDTQETPVTLQVIVTSEVEDTGVQLKKDLLQVVADHEQATMLKNMNEWVFFNYFIF